MASNTVDSRDGKTKTTITNWRPGTMLKRFLLGQWFFPPVAVCSTLFLLFVLFGWLLHDVKLGVMSSSSLEQAS